VAQIIPVNSSFERSTSRQKKYREVVVLVHNYGGNKHSFDRHVEWLNELGFDVVTFDLPARNLASTKRVPLARDWSVGLRHIWADKIEDVLGSLPENKFLFSFSYPSVAVLMALAKRHAIDVRGWIAEGGPFKCVEEGVENLMRTNAWHAVIADEYSGGGTSRPWKILKWSVDKVATVHRAFVDIVALGFGLGNYDRDVDASLKMLPKGFPVLSLRGQKDFIVTPDMIDQCFAAGFGVIDLQLSPLQNAGHLQGFRSDQEIYKQVVSMFLVQRATPIG
jgi:pimeloyl-ACP methyl ester carboxylesterase